MDSFLKNILGGDNKPAQKPISDDGGFADFAEAPNPSPASIVSSLTGGISANTPPPLASSVPTIPYTKWYRVWERTKVSDFYQEMIIAPFIIFVLAVHLIGMRMNRSKAKAWARHHAPLLEFEFASVGVTGEKVEPEKIIREQKADEYITYATGRNNVAFLDVKMVLLKRYNPLIIIGESLMGFVFESVPATVERVEAIAYSFDNKESTLVPRRKDDPEPKTSSSSYDGFVFAIVNKRILRRMREDRYDLSITATKDHPKLPAWTTTLSEHGEISESLLTPELCKAVEDAGDLFDALVISDQPLERPTKLNETTPRKRISLALRLPSSADGYVNTMPIWTYFIRLTDFLVQHAHFRPEVMKKVKQVREAQINRIKKESDDILAEERKLKADKDKKDKREALLKGMNAEEQRKFLEKEREKEMRRSQKKRTMRG